MSYVVGGIVYFALVIPLASALGRRLEEWDRATAQLAAFKARADRKP